MSELFRGFQNWADPGGKPKRDLDDMIDAYAKGGKQHAKTAEGIREVLMLSPDLNKRVLEAVRDGHLTRFSAENPGDNAAAGYNAHSRTMHIRPNFSGSHSAYAEMMFVLGHETDHARSLKGQNHATSMLLPAVNGLAEGPSVGPRDYTPIIAQYVERQRAEEAQAHIGGFNALASYVRHERHLDRAPTLKELYQTEPGRMSDFINVSGLIFKDYALKPGLAREADGSMALSDGNIDRMKVYYADKFPGTFGDNGLMDYRNQAIHGAWQEIHAAERTYVDHHATLAATAATGIDGQLAPGYAPLHHAYSIDFTALGASPAVLKFPGNGVVEVTDTMHAFATRQQSGMPMSNQELQGIREAVDPLRTAVVPTPEANRALNRRMAIDAPPDPGAASAPEPALLLQARQAMEKLGPNGGLADGTAFGNAAATLAAAAQKDGLTAIDHVVKSVDGERLIAVQGQDPASPDARHAAVEIAQAVRQPAEQTLHSLQAQASPSPGVATDTPQHAPKGHGL